MSRMRQAATKYCLLPLLLLCGFPAHAAPVALVNATVAGERISYIALRLDDPHVRVQVEVSQGFPGGDELFSSMIGRLRPVAAVSGAYFSKQTKLPIGDIVRNGQALFRGDFGTALALTPNQTPTLRRVVLSHAADWSGQQTVLGCGLALVLKSRVDVNPELEGFHDPHVIGAAARMAVGYTADRHLLLVHILSPVTFAREAVVMQALGCEAAMNLDAGASTAIYYRGKTLAALGRRLTNLLCVYER